MRNGADEYLPERNGKRRPVVPDRLPPHSPESEQAVLGCILLDPNSSLPICIEKMKDGDQEFYDLRHQTIYRIIIELYEDGIPIDVINLQERLKTWELLEQVGGLQYLSVLPGVVETPMNIESYVDTVRDKFFLRQMIHTCTDVVGRVYDHEGDVDLLLDSCESQLLHLTESRIEVQPHTMHGLIAQAINDIEDIVNHHGAVTGLASGFQDLDKVTNGMHGGQMIVIAGRPKMGKTSLALNIVEHVACDLHLGVGICELEMTARELVMRMLCSKARVSLKNLREGFLGERDYPKLTNGSAALHNAPIFINDTPGLSILQIRAQMRRWKQQHDIKLGVVDYIQLSNAMGGKRKFESRQQEVSDISCGVKNLAKELNIPILALSQMNREFEREKNRKPRLADLRESGAIEQDADFVGMLYKPNSDEDESQNSEEACGVNLLVAAQRNGPSPVDIPFTFLKSYTRFESCSKVSDEDVPQEQAGLPYSDH